MTGREQAGGNVPFKVARGRRSWTQEEFVEQFQAAARALGVTLAVSERQVRRWESSQPPWPQPPHRRVLEYLFGVPVSELGFTAPTRGTVTTHHAAVPQTTELLNMLHSPETDELLWAGDAPQVSRSTIAALWASVENYWVLDDRFGGEVLRPAVIAQLRYVLDLLRTSPYGALGGDLQMLAQEFYRLSGWTHFDSRQFAAARRYFTQAVRLARASGDRLFVANVQACMSLQATYEDKPADAIALVQAAQDTSRGIATPRITAILAMREAFAHAVLGDRAACHRALSEAHNAFETARRGDEDPAWARYFDEVKLTVDTGIARARLGEHASAAVLIEQALEQETGHGARVRAFHQLWLANTRLQAGEIQAACQIAGEAVAAAGHLESLRITEHIQGFRTRVLPYRGQEPVQQFLHTAAVSLAALRALPESTA